MFHILILIIVAGQPHILTSHEAYQTKEACEAVRMAPASNEHSVLHALEEIAKVGVKVDASDSVCEVDDGEPKAKS